MPSDDRLQAALRAVARERDAFRSAVAATAEQIRGFLGSRNGAASPGSRAVAELGAFAAGRLDGERFAALLGEEGAADPAQLEAAGEALSVLTGLLGAGDAPFRATVEPGGDPAAETGAALARAGRAFGAARVAEAVRLGRYRAERDAFLLQSFPFGRWSRAERAAAPPLVLELRGEDLRAGALAPYLDGGLKLVLLVEGPCSPAPLARLLSPNIHALQTDDPDALARIGETAGPAVAALLPEGCARFSHEPAGDGETSAGGEAAAGGETAGAGSAVGGWGRFEIEFLPEAPKARLGTASAFQQAEELRLLAALAGAAGAGAAGTAVGAGERGSAGEPAVTAPADPADRLAAWILREADLSDLAPAAKAATASGGGGGEVRGDDAAEARADDAADARADDAAEAGAEGEAAQGDEAEETVPETAGDETA